MISLCEDVFGMTLFEVIFEETYFKVLNEESCIFKYLIKGSQDMLILYRKLDTIACGWM